MLIASSIPGYIRGGATHIESDEGQLRFPRSGESVAHYPASGSRQDGAGSPEVLHVGEASVRLHEEHIHSLEMLIETRFETGESSKDFIKAWSFFIIIVVTTVSRLGNQRECELVDIPSS